jgi:hypothetical protein
MVNPCIGEYYIKLSTAMYLDPTFDIRLELQRFSTQTSIFNNSALLQPFQHVEK